MLISAKLHFGNYAIMLFNRRQSEPAIEAITQTQMRLEQMVRHCINENRTAIRNSPDKVALLFFVTFSEAVTVMNALRLVQHYTETIYKDGQLFKQPARHIPGDIKTAMSDMLGRHIDFFETYPHIRNGFESIYREMLNPAEHRNNKRIAKTAEELLVNLDDIVHDTVPFSNGRDEALTDHVTILTRVMRYYGALREIRPHVYSHYGYRIEGAPETNERSLGYAKGLLRAALNPGQAQVVQVAADGSELFLASNPDIRRNLETIYTELQTPVNRISKFGGLLKIVTRPKPQTKTPRGQDLAA